MGRFDRSTCNFATPCDGMSHAATALPGLLIPRCRDRDPGGPPVPVQRHFFCPNTCLIPSVPTAAPTICWDRVRAKGSTWPGAHFGHRPPHRHCAVAPVSASTAPVAPLRRCGREQLASSASGAPICCASAAPSILRSSGGTGELSMIQVDGGLCRLRLGPTPAPAASHGDRASPSRSRRTCQRPRSAAARPLRGRLPSAPLLSSASSTRPS